MQPNVSDRIALNISSLTLEVVQFYPWPCRCRAEAEAEKYKSENRERNLI